MKDFHRFIEELLGRNQKLFTDADFTECRKAAATIHELIHNLEETEVKFRRKLTETSAQVPQDKDKIVYLQGVCDGMNLILGPLKHHSQLQGQS
ncbi:hypothetical protein SAMN02799630_00322 [Paenibacillus sp. UNCCL117]|uniref:hypothetical protein n=1 Tax=unclassified Paenibacillus TaxID=185978 RepID=UPI000881EA6D|nr:MULTISPECIES: hypothetical protein [unclassified Paenibacillus]SDC44087.1 hypothetical protein SAMN04488602_102210 [Paenibacillus sp. cl123]SFW12815.1 hypothetical protein SAMN02799630_00322 [Paenibacillus sp. UNCCL117]